MNTLRKSARNYRNERSPPFINTSPMLRLSAKRLSAQATECLATQCLATQCLATQCPGRLSARWYLSAY